MGALTPVLTGLTTFTTAISAIDRAVGAVKNVSFDPEAEQRKALRAQQDLTLKQLSDRQRLDEQQAAQATALERQRLSSESAEAETRRRAALRRAVARQRAAFGGSGLSGEDGSSEAVLLGLFQETEEDRAAGERLNTLRSAALDRSLEDRRALNVLQRTQLQQRQNLERIYQDA